MDSTNATCISIVINQYYKLLQATTSSLMNCFTNLVEPYSLYEFMCVCVCIKTHINLIQWIILSTTPIMAFTHYTLQLVKLAVQIAYKFRLTIDLFIDIFIRLNFDSISFLLLVNWPKYWLVEHCLDSRLALDSLYFNQLKLTTTKTTTIFSLELFRTFFEKFLDFFFRFAKKI